MTDKPYHTSTARCAGCEVAFLEGDWAIEVARQSVYCMACAIPQKVSPALFNDAGEAWALFNNEVFSEPKNVDSGPIQLTLELGL